MKSTKNQLKQYNEIYDTAKNLFSDFSEGRISVDNLRLSLIGLAYNLSIIQPQYSDLAYYVDIIDCNINLFKEDPKKNFYLLSENSSGSLLNTFEPYDEIEIID